MTLPVSMTKAGEQPAFSLSARRTVRSAVLIRIAICTTEPSVGCRFVRHRACGATMQGCKRRFLRPVIPCGCCDGASSCPGIGWTTAGIAGARFRPESECRCRGTWRAGRSPSGNECRRASAGYGLRWSRKRGIDRSRRHSCPVGSGAGFPI